MCDDECPHCGARDAVQRRHDGLNRWHESNRTCRRRPSTIRATRICRYSVLEVPPRHDPEGYEVAGMGGGGGGVEADRRAAYSIPSHLGAPRPMAQEFLASSELRLDAPHSGSRISLPAMWRLSSAVAGGCMASHRLTARPAGATVGDLSVLGRTLLRHRASATAPRRGGVVGGGRGRWLRRRVGKGGGGGGGGGGGVEGREGGVGSTRPS